LINASRDGLVHLRRAILVFCGKLPCPIFGGEFGKKEIIKYLETKKCLSGFLAIT